MGWDQNGLRSRGQQGNFKSALLQGAEDVEFSSQTASNLQSWPQARSRELKVKQLPVLPGRLKPATRIPGVAREAPGRPPGSCRHGARLGIDDQHVLVCLGLSRLWHWKSLVLGNSISPRRTKTGSRQQNPKSKARHWHVEGTQGRHKTVTPKE